MVQPSSVSAAPHVPPQSSFRSGFIVRARLVAVCLALTSLVHLLTGGLLASGYVPLREALARHGLEADLEAARSLIVQRRGKDKQFITFRAKERGELADVWLARAVLSPDGRVAALDSLHNLTRTASADETTPVVLGEHALFARKVEGEFSALELLDLAGEAPTDRGVRARLQRGVTNLQTTGHWSGVGRRSYALSAPARELALRAEGETFVVDVDGERAVIDPVLEQPTEGAFLFEVRSHAAATTELVPWLVDTVREISWIGPERIAWLENKVFALRDRAKQAYHSVSAVDHAAEAAAELGIAPQEKGKTQREEEQKVLRLAVPNPESGWPPPALSALITPDVPGEGKWRAIVDDPHVRELPSGAPVFYQTFLRADEQRSWARVYLTVWDPRLVQLNMVAGTEEPVSATGETGSGMIPRSPETLRRLVGAFNGGFQAMHGEFGMMAEGRVYLPPKPWAATVAVFRDGRVSMGSWPGPKDAKAGYDEARAVAELPADLIAFRQNLTSLVEDGKFNPWGRWWWGAAPQQKSEQTLTQRSALCLTREGFMLYAWGDSASPEAMGAALVAARCARAMHLDMNAGHSGMELYRVLQADEPREDAGKKESYRFEGTLPDLPGFTVRARKAVTSMGIALPRYVHRDPRDYFYLTLKSGIETSPPPPGVARYVSEDLPHAGWPAAFARASSEGGELLRIDPTRALPTNAEASAAQVVLAELRGAPVEPKLEDVALYAAPQPVGQRYDVGVPPQEALVLLRGPLLAGVPDARSAMGVDAEGLLVYGETADKAPGALAKLMAQAGVSSALALAPGARLGLRFQEGVLGVDGSTRLREAQVALRLVASSAPAVEVMHADNKPMPYGKWAQLQDQRVRYFRTTEPTSRAPGGLAKDGP